MTLAADLALAISAAREAGALLVRAFGRDQPVEYKSADQPVTDADRAADRFLHDALRAPRPEYGWVAEESGMEPGKKGAPTWVVDPLDGTRNFVEGRPEFAVCIGLLTAGTPALGVVYNPVTDEVYSAVRGGPAKRNGDPIRAATSGPPVLAASWWELEQQRLLDTFQDDWRIVRKGSTALKMMMVAEGSAAAYVSRGPKAVWDVCGPRVIAEAAGALVVNAGGEPLTWRRWNQLIDGLIVVAPAVRNRLEEIVRRVGSEPMSGDQGGRR